ncbi:MAG: SRPBCC family protein [Myxococcales bacterium]|nr:SRPBCC family protein [Myxococcales bacterium]
MAKTLDYQREQLLTGPRERIWELLADPLQHVGLHPLIQRVDIVASGAGPGPGQRYFDLEILDRVPLLGPLALPVRYRTHMICDPSDHSFHMRATCPPRLVTEVRWSLQAVEGGTLLRERVELSAPAPLVAFSIRASRESHEAMFAALQQRLLAG